MPPTHGPPTSFWHSISPRILPHKFFIRIRILLASAVGIGRGRESTEGGREDRGELGREEDRLVKRLLAPDDFLSFDNGRGKGVCESACLYDSKGDWKDDNFMSSVTEREAADEKEPILLRTSGVGASCCRNAPSMVWVLGLKEFGRTGGLVEALSKEPPGKAS
jgi:hypothetical protein